MQFCSHAVFYLKKALKRYHVKMLLRGWLFSQKRPSPWKLLFLQMGPRHLQWQESVLSEYIAGGGGKFTWCIEFKLWQDPKYFILWNADISKITIHRKSSRSNLGRIYSNLFLHAAGYCGDIQRTVSI